MTRLLPVLVVLAATLLAVGRADAQPLGTFRWQLQPYCNVVTAIVTQNGAIYTVDGYDDQCGAAQRAPLVGLATPNPDGTIGFGLNVVTVPGGRGVQIDARITLATLGGTWSDSAGNSGTFAFGASTGGSPRPAPTTGGGGTTIPATFSLLQDGGFLARGTFGTGVIPAQNIGTRMMWHPRKAAFRAGQINVPAWDDANVGQHSTAFGFNTWAVGNASFAAGSGAEATGLASTAFGLNARAVGDYSTAFGATTKAGGHYSLAVGGATTADGYASTALGFFAATTAAAPGSFVYGDASTQAAGDLVRSISPNQFLVRASGGVVFWSSPATVYPTSPGVILFTNASSWSSLSDVNSKENFSDLEDEEVLSRIARMPVREWNYKAQGAAIRHMGPTAQDFHAAFGLGEDRLRISTIDADGVALAAVRALEARTRETNERLTRENDELRARLARLEALLDRQ